jgi:phospholipid/cholesterol/gamma-HCH transport system permease protein
MQLGASGNVRDVDVARPGAESLSRALQGSGFYGALREAGDTGALGLRAVRLAVQPPFTWIPAAVDEAAAVFRRCIIPLIVSMTVWLIGVEVIVFGNLLKDLGVADRFPGGAGLGCLREPATWITMMIFAGVGGSAVTADLGARKVREELDATAVLGIDHVRLLVVPRVVGLTFAAVILAMVGFLIVNIVNYLTAPAALRYEPDIYGPGIQLTILSIDIYASILKHLIMGFFVAVVACQRGLSCSRGAEGVGRAVNSTVVVTFFGIWLLNSFFNLGFLTLFPDASVFRG